MTSLCKVALRTVMLGTAASGDHPSIIAFIVFARPARRRIVTPGSVDRVRAGIVSPAFGPPEHVLSQPSPYGT